MTKTLTVAAVMMGVALILRLFSMTAFISTLVAAAIGGAIGIRLLGARWQTAFVAALAFGVVDAIPDIVRHITYQRSLANVPALLLSHLLPAAVAASILPGLDLTARRDTPAPKLWKAALIASVITLVIGAIELALVSFGRWGWRSYSMFGLMTLFVGGLSGLLLLGIGLILAFAGRSGQAAWARTLGLFLGLAAIVFWVSTGARWFP